MKPKSFQLWMVTLTLSVACSHAQGVPPAAVPPAGAPPAAVLPAQALPAEPQQELDLLEREYAFKSPRCNRTAEEVVDMQRRCSKARWADCVYAATMYLRGCGVAEDHARAEGLFQRACDFGSVLGCAMSGAMTKDLERSIALLEEPCARGYSEACATLGVALFNRRKEADIARATELIDRGCRDVDRRFCSALGKLVIELKLQPRFEATRALLEEACKANDLESCYVLGRVLEDGSLGAVDYDRAVALNWTTCRQYSYLPACNSLGYMWVLGRGCEADPKQGALLFYEICARGYGPGCDSMGEATEKGWGGPANPPKSLPFYDRACELDDQHACQRARELRAAGSGVAAPAKN